MALGIPQDLLEATSFRYPPRVEVGHHGNVVNMCVLGNSMPRQLLLINCFPDEMLMKLTPFKCRICRPIRHETVIHRLRYEASMESKLSPRTQFFEEHEVREQSDPRNLQHSSTHKRLTSPSNIPIRTCMHLLLTQRTMAISHTPHTRTRSTTLRAPQRRPATLTHQGKAQQRHIGRMRPRVPTLLRWTSGTETRRRWVSTEWITVQRRHPSHRTLLSLKQPTLPGI